jgi:hypothetical protein
MMNTSRASKLMKVENVLDFLLDPLFGGDRNVEDDVSDDSPFDNSDSNDTNDSILKENIQTKTAVASILTKQRSFTSQSLKAVTNNISLNKGSVKSNKKSLNDSFESSDQVQSGNFSFYTSIILTE